MVFYWSARFGPGHARWQVGRWSLGSSWHRARERWHFREDEVGKRFLELRAALRRDLFGVDADGRRGYIFVGVLQMVSVVEIDTWDSTIEVTAETASPVPAFVPVYVAALLCWLPFPDFGMNRAILRERFPMRADARSVEVLDRGSFDHILDCLSPRTIFFLAFHVIPVLAVLALALASGITVQPSQPVAL